MGRQIHGIEVLGDLDQLDSILAEHRVDGLIFTLESLPGDGVVKRVVSTCHARQLWVRQLRFEFELVE
jgi:hypothetical protein